MNATNTNSALLTVLGVGQPVTGHRPWSRFVVTAETWNALLAGLAKGRWTLLGLWGEPGMVHLAAHEFETGTPGIASLPCSAGEFPSVGRWHPPAQRLERAIADLVGLQPAAGPDLRPWLDHGRWPLRHPLGAPTAPAEALPPYPFLPTEGESLHQIPVGPVHAGIIEPGHFRFTANGEAVARLEERLGYVHKGIEGLMRGATLDRGAQLAQRTSGDSVVAYGIAFARAVEAALDAAPAPRGVWLRALMAELERIANHLGDFGAICNDAAFAVMHVQCGILREHVLRAARAAFGHRLMRDCVVPGGTAVDLAAEGRAAIEATMDVVRRRLPELVSLYDNTASLQDRTVSTGIAKPDLVRQWGAGGHVGRASGRAFDTRRQLAYAPYDTLAFDVPVRQEGDVNARVWIRIREIEQSMRLIEQLLAGLPAGDSRSALPQAAGGEGVAVAEAFRGDVLIWLRLGADGTIDRCHLRDASWFQWPLLEAAIEGNIVADFPLCNKSFNCSYSGHDL
ncbi:MAG: NADH-quinone oxidoreductase subunit C [Rhodospirillaceae bacterium]|nr:NADH-quinone oxidoreductase subunit C [Rhodospirillaceae bacterium]